MPTVAQIHAEINLKDNLSAPLKVAGESVRKFAGRARDDLGRFTIGAKKAWRDFGSELDIVSKKMQTTGLALSAGLTLPITLFGKQSLDAAAKMEGLTASMVAITGSSEAAKAQLLEVEKMAKRTATGYDLLTKASMGLIAGFDGDAKGANYVLERFATLSNVLNVSREDFDRVATNLIQIGGTSKLAGDELREMANILPNFRSLLKEAFGTSSTEELAKYGISGRKALEGISKAIDARGFKANTDTYNAQLQNLSTEFFKLKVAAGEALLPIAKNILERVVPAFQKLADTIRKLSPEQKKLAIALAATLAAAGPLIGVFGSIGSALSGIALAGPGITKLFSTLAKAFTSSGGAVGILRAGLAALTGPVGVAVALVTGFFIAWQKNLFGVQEVVRPVVARVWGMLQDLWENVKIAFESIVENVTNAWYMIYENIKPILDAITVYVKFQLTSIMQGIELSFRFITDLFNSALAGWMLIFGGGWDSMSTSMKASLLRMRSVAITVLSNIAQFFVSSFKAMTGWVSAIPGIGDFYDRIAENAQAAVDGLKAEANATFKIAEGYQKAADAERKFRNSSVGKGAPPKMRQISGSGFSPVTPAEPDGTGGNDLRKDAKPKESKEDEQKKQILQEIIDLERQLAVEKLKVKGATMQEIFAMEEYGKAYGDIQTDYRKAKVDAMVALESFKVAEEERQKALSAERDRIAGLISQRRELNKSVFDSASAMAKEREQLYFTTEEERARWDATVGGYKEASGLSKALYILQAKLLDQSRAAKTAGENWRAFWTDLNSKAKEWVKTQQEQANDKFTDYIKDLTKELLKLSGAQDKVIAGELFEQFKGAAVGKTGFSGFWKVVEMVQKVMSDMKRNKDLEDKIQKIREVAKKIEDIFQSSLDNLFENGFKSFFSSVVDGFRGLARQIAQEFVKMQLMRAALWGVGQLLGAGAKSEIAKAIDFKASGGSVFGGQPYIVGERGPELFVPNVGGSIIPRNENGSLSNGSGGGTTIVVNLQVPTYDSFKKSEAQLVGQVFGRAARSKQRYGG